jgi:hypothetical protein
VPPESFERDPPARVEGDSFTFQEKALVQLAAATRLSPAKAHHPTRVDHALPGNARARGECVHRVAYETSLTGEARQRRNLSVGRDLAPRDPANDGLDARVGAGSAGHQIPPMSSTFR